MEKPTCSTCKFWGSKPNVIVSATIRDSIQVCCHEIIQDGVIVTHGTDTCTQWVEIESPK